MSDGVKRLQIPLFKTVPGLSVFRLLNGLNLEFPERLKDVECRVARPEGEKKLGVELNWPSHSFQDPGQEEDAMASFVWSYVSGWLKEPTLQKQRCLRQEMSRRLRKSHGILRNAFIVVTRAPCLMVISVRMCALRLRIVKKLLLLPRNFRSDQPTPVVQPSQIQKTFINLSVS